MSDKIAYPNAPALPGIRSRFADNGNGLTMHYLEAGDPKAPLILLLHGFPELAYSWRKVMPALAEAGYYVVAPDLRGYGRTTGWKGNYEDDIAPFSLCRMSGDIVALAHALGRSWPGLDRRAASQRAGGS